MEEDDKQARDHARWQRACGNEADDAFLSQRLRRVGQQRPRHLRILPSHENAWERRTEQVCYALVASRH
eukprot:scaffold100174_cov60-Phaeocystis_antarctica.AAC.4